MTSRAKSSGDTPTPAAPYQIAQLPPKPSLAYTIIRGAIFLLFFLGTCVIINFAQVWSLPLLLLPNRSIYERYITYTRKSFGLLLVLITQFFGPSRVILTASPDCAKNLAKLDKDGQIEKLNLPRDLIMLSNHQIYSDWLYVWCLAYLADLHGALRIVLKASFKWVPIVGWGMQFYDFIFMKRNWSADEAMLSRHLQKLSADKSQDLFFMIFPEGTLLSDNTRKASVKWANKLGIADLQHSLLPRSLGTRFCLENLRPPYLLDLTMGYSAVTPEGFGQQFYTLRSIYMEGRSPQEVHVHVNLIDLRPTWAEMDRRAAEGKVTENGTAAPSNTLQDDVASSPKARQAELDRNVLPVWDPSAFDTWLRALWHDKDERMHTFYQNGRFVNRSKTKGDDADDEIVPVGVWDVKLKNWFVESLLGIYGLSAFILFALIWLKTRIFGVLAPLSGGTMTTAPPPTFADSPMPVKEL